MWRGATGRYTFLLLICIGILPVALATTALCLEVPQPPARVTDLADILSPASETQLNQYLEQLEQSDSTQIVVLTVPSLEGANIEQYSLQVAEAWRIGQAEHDNGALLLIAVQDREMRIEVGYGLEGSLTDLVAGRIIRNVIRPRFQQGDFDQGIVEGVHAMAQTVRGEYAGLDQRDGRQEDDLWGLFAMLMFFFFFIGNILRRSKLASAVTGGIGAPIIGLLFQGFSLALLIGLIPVGIVMGLIMTKLPMRTGRSGVVLLPGGFRGGGGGGFGGFSGGGGGFGGGGASGGW